MDNKNRKRIIRYFVCFVITWIITSFAWYIFELAHSLQCAGMLEGVGSHFPAYQQKNNGANPLSLNALIDDAEILKEKHLSCPAWYFNNDTREYIYRGNDLNTNVPGYMILIYEKENRHRGTEKRGWLKGTCDILFFGFRVPKGRMVLFSNGEVKLLGNQEFFAALHRDIETRGQMGLNLKKDEYERLQLVPQSDAIPRSGTIKEKLDSIR